ncbi:MAG: hypothetical protein DRN78_03770 [Thermoproteota archaeon]|nr:MAG: hypothetical protein DRN78_03770 [Candidatus Korarchaeota archaeon]
MLRVIENARVMGSYHNSCIVIENGVIKEVGGSSLCDKYRGVAKYLDAQGKVVIPGLIDSHMHLSSYAVGKVRLDLRGVTSIEDLKEAVRSRALSLGESKWIVGMGWDHEQFREKRLPNRFDLDEVAPNNPVLLIRVCGHMGVANTLALRKLGLESEEGHLYEDRLYEALKRVPKPPNYRDLLLDSLYDLASYGITRICSMSVLREELDALLHLRERLPIWVHLFMSEEDYTRVEDGRVSVEGIKVFADGSFGARTAALREDYADDPGNRGVLLKRSGDLVRLAKVLEEDGKMLAVHAIGDRALEEVLGALKLVKNIRVEHASLMPPDLLQEFKNRQPVVFAVQPHFTISDSWLEERLGDRVKYAYNYRAMIEAGFTLAGSSDAPIEPVNPWISIGAALTGGLLSVPPLAIDEALEMYTSSGLRACGVKKAPLSPGSPADLVILDESPWHLNKLDIPGIRALLTFVEGNVVYGEGKWY